MPDVDEGMRTAVIEPSEELPVETTDASGPGARLDLEGVRKVYGDAVAVDGVDLCVKPGEFLTFLGPSGSGKTTTLNIIAGFVDASEGVVSLGGRQVEQVPAHRRNIGMVFQSYALFPHMTVRKNVEFPLRQRRVPKQERDRLVDEALKTVRLEGYEERYPKQLSGGQQQRVALARAMVFKPGLLLLDEPLGALDKALREWLQLELKRIHREVGCTFVYVTHDQEEALVLSDRIAIFNEGKIEQIGTAKELYEDPATLFVGTFMGKSSIFHGVGKAANGAADVELQDGSHVVGSWPHEHESPDLAAILVRPENLDLVRPGEQAPAGWNSVRVTIKEIIYLGGTWMCSLVLPGDRSGLVITPWDPAASFSVGDSATVTWDPVKGRVLKA